MRILYILLHNFDMSNMYDSNELKDRTYDSDHIGGKEKTMFYSTINYYII
jgi:hypothetical protein